MKLSQHLAAFEMSSETTQQGSLSDERTGSEWILQLGGVGYNAEDSI